MTLDDAVRGAVRCVETHMERFGRAPTEVFLPPLLAAIWFGRFGPFMAVALQPKARALLREDGELAQERDVPRYAMRVHEAPFGEQFVSVR